jgi:hypothetical protein
MFDPVLGRFLQRDAAWWADGTDLYRYASDNPADRLDPLGEVDWANAAHKNGTPEVGPNSVYEVKTAMGRTVRVWKGDPKAPVKDRYYCHGLTFGGVDEKAGRYYSPIDVRIILEDEWKVIDCCDAQENDIAVWGYGGHKRPAEGGDIIHSATFAGKPKTEVVDKVKRLAGTTELRTKNESDPEKTDTWDNLRNRYGANISCYRKLTAKEIEEKKAKMK